MGCRGAFRQASSWGSFLKRSVASCRRGHCTTSLLTTCRVPENIPKAPPWQLPLHTVLLAHPQVCTGLQSDPQRQHHESSFSSLIPSLARDGRHFLLPKPSPRMTLRPLGSRCGSRRYMSKSNKAICRGHTALTACPHLNRGQWSADKEGLLGPSL